MRKNAFLCVAAVCFICLDSPADDWPAWRGPEGTGISSEGGLPIRWSRTDNVAWKAPLPGAGNSTPIVWKNHVFVTCPIDDGRVRSLLCFDRKTGRKLWQHEIPFPEKETHHRLNPFCSGSPTTDGERVYASFGSAGVIACDFDGNVLWHRKPGKLTHVFGQATTPVLYKDQLIVYRGPGEPTHIVALDKRKGHTIWDRKERARNSNLFGSWATPVILRVGGRDEMIMALPEEIKGYDPATGKELWRCAGLGTEVYAMPIVGENLIVGICGHKGPTMAVRPGGAGDVTKTHRLWLTPKNDQRVSSGVIHKGHLYQVNNPGTAECIEGKTGKVVWKERLGGKFWASILLSDGKLYVANEQGEFFVLAASPQFRLIAKIPMNEHVKAAAAASDGQLFLRTYEHLYCIGERKSGR